MRSITVVVRPSGGPGVVSVLLVDDSRAPYSDPATVARVVGDAAAQLAKRSLRVRTRPEEGGR